MESALSGGDVAAVLMETIPATYGFPLPAAGYLPGVKRLCERFGSVYIADEVQTGLGRTGRMWAVECFDVAPDILVTGKGLSGGLYPISAAVLGRKVAGGLPATVGGISRHSAVPSSAAPLHRRCSRSRRVRRSCLTSPTSPSACSQGWSDYAANPRAG
jgi:acetylornithine/succinyldiaminopimelate/putrescine aminotransferase